ncbi:MULTISPECIES: hypothetical protein [Snodgrassella]|uniref:Uncharacterized protein n=1 Tax=Snodgrassella alvi TaxID=1196083 RepID=A0A2N9WS66_9NEIS|nr:MULTISPECIES: hypothetical protein [Snodgrassella]NUE66350.1 hypothetical protein [Snodgrassella sp. ESL0253]PIT13389.1 hypothetical protein BGI32_09225 [Snodgrassella alvi]
MLFSVFFSDSSDEWLANDVVVQSAVMVLSIMKTGSGIGGSGGYQVRYDYTRLMQVVQIMYGRD